MKPQDLLAELLKQWQSNDPTGQTITPEDLCRDCPELLEDFRELVRQRAQAESHPGGETTSDADDPGVPYSHIQAGRYRPLNYHAKGGLGVVFLAEDRELHRN